MASPNARGTFRKAIFESGAAPDLPGTCDQTGHDEAETAGTAFARRLGATTADQGRALQVKVLIAHGVLRAVIRPILDGKIIAIDFPNAYRSASTQAFPVSPAGTA